LLYSGIAPDSGDPHRLDAAVEWHP